MGKNPKPGPKPAPGPRPSKSDEKASEAPAVELLGRRPFWRRHRLTILVMAGILLLAAAMRMTNLGQSPPGTLDDECVEIWNAECLLKTGMDWHGEHWPILSTRGQGDNRSTLLMYCLIPFEALGGMSVPSARFGVAVMGVLEVLLMYVVAARLFGRNAGLLAAAMLALCPWHLRNSRYAFMANSFFLTLPLAMLLLANLPLGGVMKGKPRPVLAFVAGAVTGLCCYAYPSIRLFLPLFLGVAVAVNWRAWWQAVRTRASGIAIAAAGVGLALTLGPLAWAHVAHPERMSKRAANIMAWKETDSTWAKMWKTTARYPGHFGPSFLFVEGDGEEGRSVVRRVPETGAFQWYLLPAMLVGLGAVVPAVRTNRTARVLLAGVLLYPAADLFFQAQLPTGADTSTFFGFMQAQYVHLYRSLPGLPMLILLAALGAAEGGKWLWMKRRPFFWLVLVAMSVWVLIWTAGFLARFYGDYNRLPKYYECFEGPLVDSMRCLRPKYKDAVGIFVAMGSLESREVPTRNGIVQQTVLNDVFGFRAIYLVTLVELGYEPLQWFSQPKELHRDAIGPPNSPVGDTDWVSSYGKVHFGYSPAVWAYWHPRPTSQDQAEAQLPWIVYDLPAWKELAAKKPAGPVYIVVPPSYPRPPEPARVVNVHEVRGPNKDTVLLVCEVRFAPQ